MRDRKSFAFVVVGIVVAASALVGLVSAVVIGV